MKVHRELIYVCELLLQMLVDRRMDRYIDYQILPFDYISLSNTTKAVGYENFNVLNSTVGIRKCGAVVGLLE